MQETGRAIIRQLKKERGDSLLIGPGCDPKPEDAIKFLNISGYLT
jgi:hypothetical protein